MQFEFVENDPEGEGFVGKLCVAYGAFDNVCFEIFLAKKVECLAEITFFKRTMKFVDRKKSLLLCCGHKVTFRTHCKCFA